MLSCPVHKTYYAALHHWYVMKKEKCRHRTSGPALMMNYSCCLPFMWTVIHNYTESYILKSFTYEIMSYRSVHFYFIPCTVSRMPSHTHKRYTHNISKAFASMKSHAFKIPWDLKQLWIIEKFRILQVCSWIQYW